MWWTRARLVPRHLRPDEVIDAVAQVAAACESGLASEPDPEVAVVLSRSLAETTPDAVLLEQWLVDRATHTGIELDPTMRWSAIRRLAALGALSPEEIDDERRGDGTVVGELGAARALAAIPHPEAKAGPGPGCSDSARLQPDLRGGRRRVLGPGAGGAGPPLRRPLPRRGAGRGPAPAGRPSPSWWAEAFPNIPLGEPDVAAVESALAGDVPTVLRREWEDHLDDLRLTLR